MSRAEDLADFLEFHFTEYERCHPNDAPMCESAAAELRRLAQVEAEHAALLKAISDAIPVFWYRPVMNGDMYEGPHHNNSFVGRLQRAEKPSEWLPLYTLNGIKP